MAAAETEIECTDKLQPIGLGELQESFVRCLGTHKLPMSADQIMAHLPADHYQAFTDHVRFVALPIKSGERAEIGFIEHFLVGTHGYLDYSYEKDATGYVLNEHGWAYYEILSADEPTTVFPETQPAADSVVRSVGGGTLAAVWTT